MRIRTLALVLLACTLGAADARPADAAGEPAIELLDPKGDDDGPGSYVYPTSLVYTPGAFDLTRLRITPEGDHLRIAIEFAAPVGDPWRSKGWKPPGNGFSLQLAFLFLSTGAKRHGHRDGLPGLNVRFADGSPWDRLIIISPQANARVQAEIQEKIPDLAPAVVLPSSVSVRGREIVARVPIAVLGRPRPGWGVQLVIQSNEGYPAPDELMTRRVDRSPGLHRFGGGRDDACDPHVIDLLAAPAKGTAAEADAQHELLLDYDCSRPARLPLIRWSPKSSR